MDVWTDAKLINLSYHEQISLCNDLLARRWKKKQSMPQLRHSLSEEVIVSITSYPARYHCLDKSLMCLLSQSVRPDRVVLWISYDDISSIPASILGLVEYGLEIIPTVDIGPYKKIIPAIHEYPESFIVTADDDVFYGDRWLEALIDGWQRSHSAAICHRAHRIRYGEDGQPLPYMQWDFEIRTPETTPDVFATGCGGVLFAPRSLHPDVLRHEIFMDICHQADDVWLYWMLRKAGNTYSKIGNQYVSVNLPDSQTEALAISNQSGGNDRKLKNIIRYYGESLFIYQSRHEAR